MGKVIFSVTCVKNSVHGGAGTPQQAHLLGRYTPWAGTPPAGTPPGRYTPARYTPWAATPPSRYTPWQVHPGWAGTPSWASTPPWQVHPPEQCMLGDTGNKRAVRILLEYILAQMNIQIASNIITFESGT